ncbi:MAG: DUF3179 domain-containing protein [Verrucomicrobiota bacterium]
MTIRIPILAALGGILIVTSALTDSLSASDHTPKSSEPEFDKLDRFMQVFTAPPTIAQEALTYLESHWSTNDVPMAIEGSRFIRSRDMLFKWFDVLEKKTRKSYSDNWSAWSSWIWQQPTKLPDNYAEFKSRLYRRIDPRFAKYFDGNPAHTIRLDEIVWGGVVQDGIPPLRSPKMISAKDADYLEDSNVIFGLEVNGDVRAYPKRILAWHEMFVDTVGGVPVAGVYCTLCGSMILYETETQGTNHAIGTSGFLYRSNKLMYDRKTNSLWSTLEGTPVVGSLFGKDIYLPRRSVVTTTWGEWKKRYPESKVLSLDTGHTRDYGEGVAYRDYFATDKLMFPVPGEDKRLANKAEIVGILLPDTQQILENSYTPLAVDSAYLNKHPLYHSESNGVPFIIVTDKSGANRIYERNAKQTFKSWDGKNTLKDASGKTWRLTEAKLTSSDGKALKRLPGHRAFWFGWKAAFPDTKLVSLK